MMFYVVFNIFSLSTRHCSRWISCICQTDCLCYDRSVQGIRPSCLSVVEVTSNLSGGSYTVNDKQGSTHPADWASYLKPRQRLRAVLTSSRHPPVAVVPPPGLGTPGRGFTAWYLSVFFYVFTFSQCLDESEHMIGNENAIEAALILFS